MKTESMSLSQAKSIVPAGDTEDLESRGPAPVQAPTADFGRAAQGPWTPKSQIKTLFTQSSISSFFAKFPQLGRLLDCEHLNSTLGFSSWSD